MNSNNNLVLIGMMGSGKSIIGSLLSENLNLEFNDVDKIIEKEAGFKVSEIFKKEGEYYFRKLEEKVTLQLLKSQNTIVSLGGGGFVNTSIRNQVLKNHLSFWLNWKNSTLINRIIKSKKRPIAFNSSINEIKKTNIKSFNYDQDSLIKNQGTILDHIDQDCLILLDNPNSIFKSLNENIKQLNNSKQSINNFITPELKSYIYKFKTIEIFPWQTKNSISIEKIFNIKNIPELSIDSSSNQESKINLINNFQGQKIIHTSYINRTKELFNKINQIQIIETPPYKSTPGFIYNSNKSSFILIGDKELYGTKYISTIDETRRKEIIKNDEINPGDYIVHSDHGIGKFINFGKPPKSNSLQDYMIIEYAKSDKLYVPLTQIQKIAPYIAPTNKIPKLTTLGGESWTKAKQKAQESALKWARELLTIYAKRELSKGIKYSDDNEWEKDLEGSFPFKETPDQTSAIELIKNKMQSKNPMDVLICGDVGFGKTEVAIRAAFKAVCNGKQVAVIAPTTILTQQHYETFSNRLSAFPVNIEYLSRFKTKAEQKVIVNNIKKDYFFENN